MATLIKESSEEIAPRGRGRPRDEEARARILDATLQVLENTCFPNATVDAIAERAGVSKATIYRWWPNKAAVFIEALREATAQELPFPDTGDLEQDVNLQLQNFVKLLTGPRGRTFKAFIAAAQSDPEVAEAYRELWIKPRRVLTRERLKRHQRAGRMVGNVDLEALLDVLYGGFYFRLMAGHGDLSPAFADEAAKIALQGLVPRGK
ncbi:MAG TPA: TetR/AcrR family transcriptional regulator [Bryobacteraceae bacterium]|nr:TetR/AcrR family transcriptional regulator [Bryobacteraceae bacterium]